MFGAAQYSIWRKWIDNNLLFIRSESFSKKGQDKSWIEAKTSMKFYYETIDIERFKDSIYSVSTSLPMYLLRFRIRRMIWAGKTHAQEGKVSHDEKFVTFSFFAMVDPALKF